MSEPEHILIIRPSALGDVCRSVPIAASLRQRFPGARIAWLVQVGFEDAVVAHPAVDEVLGFARRGMSRPWRRGDRRRLRAFVADLRRRRFDLVLDAQGLARSGLIAWATRAPVRIGHAAAREGAWLAYTERVVSAPGAHAVDRMLDLVEAAGAPRIEDLGLVVPPDAAAWWAPIRRRLGGRPYVVVAPTARWRCKQWPAERFAAIVRHVLDGGRHVVLVGAPGEEEAVAAARPAGAIRLTVDVEGDETGDRVQADASDASDVTAASAVTAAGGDGRDEGATGSRAGAVSSRSSSSDPPASPGILDLAGRTRVGQMMAVLDGAAAVVAGDSAALHMATGLGTPAVALFGPTDPRLVGPRGGPATVLRRVEPGEDPIRYRRVRDDDRYMRRLAVEDVAAAVDAWLDDGEAAA